MGLRSSGWAAGRGGNMAATSNGTPAPKPVRCAIYTRKSTEEGLNQEFNSLDAQREAGEAYIVSQKHDGWTLVPTQYSDGGYTGANIERPGVKQLLADIEAGKIDCVVVYKVDRLSRSLIDFSKMMELFEKRGVCFVSVTQQFNTNSSLGRLTLNILLSFAQFEREIISERTRDKQVAARKKGSGLVGTSSWATTLTRVPGGWPSIPRRLSASARCSASTWKERRSWRSSSGSTSRGGATSNGPHRTASSTAVARYAGATFTSCSATSSTPGR
jgi:DNA invertase Pin-like site-specific DNA recombinase